MKNLLLSFTSILLLFSCHVPQDKENHCEIIIVPMPLKVELPDGTFQMTEKTSIKADHSLALKAEQLRSYLYPASGFQLPVNKRIAGGNIIELKLDDELSSAGEKSYRLNITYDKILITAYSLKGILWGIQTLRQLFPRKILREAEVGGIEWSVPCIN